MGLHPKPALLFFIAKKVSKKASTPGSHKIYFYPGILQLPTVGQVKCLYNSVKNKFYRRLQRGALNGNDNNKSKQQTTRANNDGNGKNKRKKHQKSTKYTLFNRAARRGKIKISKNYLKIKGRGKVFWKKLSLKYGGFACRYLIGVVLFFFFDKFCL